VPHANTRYTDRLRLEPIGPKNAADLLKLLQDPAVAEWYGVWTPEMVRREADRIGQAWETNGIHKWMAYDRETGELIGRGGLSRAHVDGKDRLEIGWALLGQSQGHGYATEIGRAGLALAFDELNAGEVVSFTEARNSPSRAVMERLGFHYLHDITLEDGGEPFALYALERADYIKK
jgi:ribosomal-protein-alanine N-acetyltransferase